MNPSLFKPFTDALVALKNEERKSQETEARGNELEDKLSAFKKNNKLGLVEADGKLKHASKEIGRLQDNIKKLKAQLEVWNCRDGFTGGGGAGLGGAPPSPGQRGCRVVLFFMIKQKIIRGKMRFSNLSNNMMISKL